MKYIGHLEITGAVIRVMPTGVPLNGDNVEVSVAVVGDEGLGTIKGLVADEKFTLEHAEAILESMRNAGFHEVHWRRRRKGQKVRECVFKLGSSKS